MKPLLTESLLNLLFPCDTVCVLCSRTLAGSERTLCSYCEDDLRQCILTPLECVSVHKPLVRCISAFSYQGAARNLIHVLKYRSNATVAPIIGMYMCAALLRFSRREWDVIVPVPLHPERLRKRGYNQAQLLAEQVACCFRYTLRTDLLIRMMDKKSQTTRRASERRIAMKGVFRADPKAAGLRILLVDDVLTTGATATACAQALLEAGAVSVTLLTACQA